MAFHANLNNREMKGLDEILGVQSNESSFDEDADILMEKVALKNLELRKVNAKRG